MLLNTQNIAEILAKFQADNQKYYELHEYR